MVALLTEDRLVCSSSYPIILPNIITFIYYFFIFLFELYVLYLLYFLYSFPSKKIESLVAIMFLFSISALLSLNVLDCCFLVIIITLVFSSLY